MRPRISWVVIVCAFVAMASLCFAKENSVTPENGFVPDEETAVAIAEAVLTPIYGSKTVNEEKPFEAALKDGVWYVKGSLSIDFVGGVATVEISQEDGCILRVNHGR